MIHALIFASVIFILIMVTLWYPFTKSEDKSKKIILGSPEALRISILRIFDILEILTKKMKELEDKINERI